MIRERWVPDGFFALRTPLLPFDALHAWGSGLEAAHAVTSGGNVVAACRRDRIRLRERLSSTWARPELAEALYVASPSLHERIGVWTREPDGKRGRGVERALVKYFQRMAFRCTPFGLFAGGSVGRLGKRTVIELVERGAYARHTRLDTGFLSAVVEALAGDPSLRRELRWFPNTSLYRVAGAFRYAESTVRAHARSYDLVDARADDVLVGTLERARAGASYEELVDALTRTGVRAVEASAYVDELIDAQLLGPGLAVAVTGPDAIDDVITQLAPLSGAAAARGILERVRAELAELDAAGLGCRAVRYRRLTRLVEPLPAEADSARLFHVDLIKPVACAELGPDVVEELEEAVDLVARLSPTPEETPLDRFRRDFEERWGSREIPLVRALDEEIGLGFDSPDHGSAHLPPLLDGLPLRASPEPARMTLDARAAWLRAKLDRALLDGAQEIVLDGGDLPGGTEQSALPDAFAILASIRKPHGEGDPVAELRHASGPSGARLLGRFCHGDPELEECVRGHLAAEEALAPDVTFFEIVHLPEGRFGNVICRPRLREYELPYLGRAGGATGRALSVGDLLVSVQGGRIVLRSRSLDREVRPRLTSAHETRRRSVPIYRFLAAIQLEEVLPVAHWTWAPFDGSPFLPRVRFRRVILSPRRWSVPAAELQGASTGSDAEAFGRVQHWRRERALPRYVGVVDADHVMPVDLENVLSVDALLGLVRGRAGFRLEELCVDDLAVHGPEGCFRNEVIIPYVARVSSVPRAARRFPDPDPGFRDEFAPGSRWLSAKIYTGVATADAILRDVIAPLARDATARGITDAWFFVRFADPGWHLRVRFRGDPIALSGRLLPALHERLAPYLDDGRVSGLVIDTYRRETSRYGGSPGIEICEGIFRHDSEAVVEMLASLEGTGPGGGWQLALVGMDRLLDDFGLDLRGKHSLMASVADGFARELRVEGSLHRAVMKRLRSERRAVPRWISGEVEAGTAIAAGLAVLGRRSEQLRPPVAELRQLAAAGRLQVPIPDLVASLAHMHANRILRSAARAQEMMISRLLERTYDSLLARGGKRAPGEQAT